MSSAATAVQAERAVLLLLDLQNDIVDERGKFAVGAHGQAAVDEAVQRAAAALDWARDRSVPVAHVAVQYRPGQPEAVSRVPLLDAVRRSGALVAGTWGARFHPAVAPRDGEWVVTKPGVSAFAGNDLALLIAGARRTQVLLCGVSTNLVVLGTAFSCVDLGLDPVVLADACAASSSAEHDAALQLLAPVSQVSSCQDLPL